MMNCTVGHAALATSGACTCYAPYYGPACEHVHLYWQPVAILTACADALSMLGVLAWTCVCFAALVRRQRAWCLADTLVLLNGLAALLQLAYDVLPTAAVTGVYPTTLGVGIASALTVPVATALWLAATALALGFWLDVARLKFRLAVGPCTRVVCWVAAAAVVVAVPGVVMLAVAGTRDPVLVVLAALLVLAPLFLDTLLFVVVVALVTRTLRRQAPSLSPRARRRMAETRRWLWVMVGGWLAFDAALALAAAGGAGTLVYPALHVPCRAAVAYGLLMVAARRRRRRRRHPSRPTASITV